ncbi:hypothetical protein GX51_01133 [Blastomyces parvus]|uniref:Uncharacterized protein n=1 Tax=Blastomyces parvus TaxID=2060905 RepID=A0A2B7XIL9_9EURO|nr:hypothetical protein GX51_01133 [Blastomyces parvus]
MKHWEGLMSGAVVVDADKLRDTAQEARQQRLLPWLKHKRRLKDAGLGTTQAKDRGAERSILTSLPLLLTRSQASLDRSVSPSRPRISRASFGLLGATACHRTCAAGCFEFRLEPIRARRG